MRLIYSLLHRADESKEGRNNCLWLQIDPSPKWRRPMGDWKLGVWRGIETEKLQLKIVSLVKAKIVKYTEI